MIHSVSRILLRHIVLTALLSSFWKVQIPFIINSNVFILKAVYTWRCDPLWWHRSVSTLAWVMAYCLMAPTHYHQTSPGTFIWEQEIPQPLIIEISLKNLFKCPKVQWVNSSPPSAAYMRQWTRSALVQVMACRMFGAKPAPEPMLVYCQLDSWQQISVKLELEFYHFHWRKFICNCRLPTWRPFCPGSNELIYHFPLALCDLWSCWNHVTGLHVYRKCIGFSGIITLQKPTAINLLMDPGLTH